MARHSIARRAAVGLCKAAWWTTKLAAKGAWWASKNVYHCAKAVATHAHRKIARPAHSAPQFPATHTPVTVVKTVRGDFFGFQHRLHNESSVILIAGRRGSGKSVTGFRFLENIHAVAKRPCYAIGPSQSVLPQWISSITDLSEAGNRGAILVDEGAISFGSRESMSRKNRKLGELLAIARHKDLSLILITQNTGMIDKNVLGLCDSVVFKEGSLLQEKMERSAIKDIYQTAHAALQQASLDERNQHCYILDATFEGLCRVALPSFWSEKVSKNQA